MLDWIAESKLTPPDPPADLVARALPGVDAASVVALVAGPGYGKTVAMRALWDAAPEGAVRLWYTLDADDADPATCFTHLAQALAAIAPGFGDALRAAIGAGLHEPKLLWQRLFEAVAAYAPPAFVLALDDVHALDEAGAPLLAGLAPWLGRLPGHVRVLLAGRRPPPFPMAKLVAQGRARIVGPEALRLAPAEAEAFLARGGLAPDVVRAAAEALEGWPLGLALQARGQAALAAPGADDPLAGYIAEEVVSGRPPGQQAFMRRLALLHEPDAGTVAAALDLTPDEARAALAALEADHLATRLAQGSHGARPGAAGGERWRLPGWLAAWLLADAARQLAASEVAAIHARAGEALVAAERPEAALPHLVAARAWPAAVVACRAAFPLMSAYGRKAAIRRALAGFPPEAVEAEPYLLVWAGHDHLRNQRLPEAGAAYARARAIATAAGDAPMALEALVREAQLALWTGDAARHAALAEEAAPLLAQGVPESVIDHHLGLALAAELAGDAAGMRAHNEAVLGVPAERVAAAQGRALALVNLCTAALQRGKLAEAARHADEAVALTSTWRFFGPLRLATALRAHLALLAGDVAGAAALDDMPPFWEDALAWPELGVVLTILGHLHQRRGDGRKADEALRRASDTFARGGFREGMLVPLERRLWGLVARDEPARAVALAAEAEGLDGGSVHALAARLPLARAHHLLGRPAEALALLGPAIAALTDLGAELLLARAHQLAAAAHAAAGDPAAAAAALAAAEGLIAANAYGFLREDDARLQGELRAIGVPHPRPAATPAPAPAPAGHPPPSGGEVPARAEGGDIAPTTDRLDIRAFGLLEVRRGGVVQDQWARKKAKLVLAALLLSPRGVDADALAELVAGGEPGAGEKEALQSAISALRRVLAGPERGRGHGPVVLRDGRYMLDWDAVEAYDVRAFDEAVDAGDALRARAPAEAAAHYQRAVALLGGALLADGAFAGRFEPEREHYRRRAVGVLRWLADHHGAQRRDAEAEACLARAIALAPCDEDAYVALARHHRVAGRPDRVRQAYWDCRKALKAHLGLAPSAELEAAFRALA